MQKFFFIAIFILGSLSCNGQFRYSGQSAVSLYGGGVSKGFFVNASYQRFLNEKGSMIRGDIDYTSRKQHIPALDTPFDTGIVSLGAAYGYSFNEIFGEFTFVHLWAGAFGAKETYDFNEAYKHMIVGNTDDPVTYGLYGGIEAELHLTTNISLMATYLRWQNFKSDFAKHMNKFGGGVKFYFK
ncbi:hypothetical protein [Sinomicrobium weinanense]|uniref:Outer membrane protein beta-barrel domain-containing protein n=1 Tax=Sinomicrobium weinanense TaxID=2842200 RepID=A0A926Q0T4_9FLAO|nr:hypothetical protein [Sinomicrobium weinanense]MBC9795068.1 hypothetical protein [Sinomicrobium weinanense]MBU3123803.1 hypothetical protein [Sinomicrobium weinanense]